MKGALSRKGYVERIHAVYVGQGMPMATHDVLMQHDAAQRKRIAVLERALENAIGWARCAGYIAAAEKEHGQASGKRSGRG